MKIIREYLEKNLAILGSKDKEFFNELNSIKAGRI